MARRANGLILAVCNDELMTTGLIVRSVAEAVAAFSGYATVIDQKKLERVP